MRKYAYLKEPIKCNNNEYIYKIMLYKTIEVIYLFEYCSMDAVQCSHDLFYDSLDDLYEEWNYFIDEKDGLKLRIHYRIVSMMLSFRFV